MPGLILHGGAGSWRESRTREKAVKTVEECTRLAWDVLGEKDAVTAVVAAVKCMEDSGYLNAGWGSVLDLMGGRSLDAGLMASNGLLGAVAAVTATKNPILLAQIVAVETPHIFMGGAGADMLAREHRLPPLPPPPSHVWERHREALKKILGGEARTRYGRSLVEYLQRNERLARALREIAGLGDTVGAVAVDDEGLLAAAVSTGGVILKLPGRIGDSPVPGAGFYATQRVACSSTGYGEQIIKAMPCLRLSDYMNAGLSLEEALDKTIEHVNTLVGRDTMGFIAVDSEGRIGWRYNTEAMLVGYIDEQGKARATAKP